MSTPTTILLVFISIILLLLIVARFMRKDYTISCEVVINAPSAVVFSYIRHLKNQDNFNKWVMVDPTMQRTYKGTDGTVGFVYGWRSPKAGEGEQEITSITEGKIVDTEIRFVKPFQSIAHAGMTITALTPQQTQLTWTNASTMKYPMNLMLSAIVKMLTKDMNTSLHNLKIILEK